jgi:predicted aconitase
VCWAESNAIVFANSVLGARTNRYGDFMDICAAITGLVPDSGLHREENRRARLVFNLGWLSERGAVPDAVFGLIGHVVGLRSGGLVPAIIGLPTDSSEDQLKALSAAAASSGAVAMFHAVGVTPEAPDLDAALGGSRPDGELQISAQDLRDAWADLNTAPAAKRVQAVSVGTPHYSLEQLTELDRVFGGRTVDSGLSMYVSTGRDTLAKADELGIGERLAGAGVQVVTDTCTYVTSILRAELGSAVMTDSAKWAWYAPGNLKVEVVYGSLEDCVETAVSGRVVQRIPNVLRD